MRRQHALDHVAETANDRLATARRQLRPELHEVRLCSQTGASAELVAHHGRLLQSRIDVQRLAVSRPQSALELGGKKSCQCAKASESQSKLFCCCCCCCCYRTLLSHRSRETHSLTDFRSRRRQQRTRRLPVTHADEPLGRVPRPALVGGVPRDVTGKA